MKKQYIIYVTLIALTSFLGSSCKDFLEEEPKSTWGVDSFYSTEAEAEIAIAGIYSVFASGSIYGHNLSIGMSSGTDEGYYNRRWNEGWPVGLYRHTSSTGQVKGLWESLYRAINLTNLFIEKLNTENFEQSKYNQLIAEAKFLRAHSYFLLTSWYNEVPLTLTPTEDQSSNHLPASSLEEVYAQIISDYSFAAENLLVATDKSYTKGRVHKMAAHGLLARVYLKMAGYPLQDTEKYALAKEQCEIVIADGYHGLNTAEGNGYRNHFLSYII